MHSTSLLMLHRQSSVRLSFVLLQQVLFNLYDLKIQIKAPPFGDLKDLYTCDM